MEKIFTEMEKLIWASAFAQYCKQEMGDCSKPDRLIAMEAAKTADTAIKYYRIFDTQDSRIPH